MKARSRSTTKRALPGASRSRLVRAALLTTLAIVATGCTGEPPWNVLVVTLDTTRADHLSCYGREDIQTPNYERLAAEGLLFEQAMTTAPITLPSHSTIFTGRYPLAHGVRDNGLFTLPESELTLAERFQELGYATGAVVASYPVTREFGIAQGFEFFDDHITVGLENFRGERTEPQRGVYFDERSAAQVNDAILPWLREHADEPFMAWIHYWDAHQPLIPPAPFDQLYAYDLYLGEIAFVDQSFGKILDFLEEAGIADRTLVVVVGDHGEGRKEHREDSHSMLVYDSTLHVPLIMKVPGIEGGRRLKSRVGTVDIVPTILDFFGLPIDDQIHGRSLAEWMRSGEEERDSRGLYYAETLSPRFSHGWGEMRALFDGSSKYIHGPRPELYDLNEDPRELNDLAPTQHEEAAEMKAALGAFIERRASSSSADAVQSVDAETRQRLAALGYLSSSGESPGTVKEELVEGGIAPQDRIHDITLMSQAKQLLDRKEYVQARERVLRLIELDPGNAFYRSLLASAYLGLGQVDEAASVIEEAEALVSVSDAAFLAVAQRVFASGNEERGLALARLLVNAHDSGYGRYLLGEMLLAQGEEEAGEQELEAALALDGGLLRARLSLAIQLAKRQQHEAATEHFEALLRRQPFSERGHYNYAVMLLGLTRYDEALDKLARAIQLNPSYWPAHLARLAIYVEQEQTEQADAALGVIERRCRKPQIVERARNMAGAA